jgi:hypothetical protein
MAVFRALRDACGGSNNTFTAGNGHHPGRRREIREKPGDWPLARVPGRGGRRAAKTSNWPADAARPGTAPPSHTWRALPDSARQEHLARAATPTTAGMPAAMIWLRPSRARFPGPPRRAGDDKRESRRAGNRPMQDRRSASSQDWMPHRREQRRLRGAGAPARAVADW